MTATDNEPKTAGQHPADPKEPEPAQGAAAGQQPADPEGAGAEGEPSDKHGQPGINREKYQRDIKERDDKIAELQAKVDESAKTEEGRAAIQKQLDELKAEAADKQTTYELKLAGCRDERAIKAAKSLLADYGGDVDKLKADCPYLFEEQKKKGSTGLKPEGSTDALDDDKLDRAFGLKK